MVHTQSNEFAVLLVNVTVKGAHPSVTLAMNAAFRVAFTVTSTWSVFVHPAADVPVTVYVVTPTAGVNATPFVTVGAQVYVAAPEPVSTTVWSRHVSTSFPAKTFGIGFTVTRT
jgi:hypothetical protein